MSTASPLWVGATGFTTPAEVHDTWKLLTPWPAMAARSPAFGVYTTHGTLRGIPAGPDDWEGRHPARYPEITKVRSILEAMPRPVIRVLSYVFRNDQDTFEPELLELFATVGMVPDAVQVNQLSGPPVPQVKAVIDFMRHHGSAGHLVWQLPPHWLDARHLVLRLRPYINAGVNRLLFDRSCGDNEAADAAELTRVVIELREAFPSSIIGLAGAVSADRIDELPDVGPVSYEACSRLRYWKTDALAPGLVAAYMRRGRR